MKKNKSIIPILLVVAIVLFAGIFGVLKLTENTDGVGKAEKKLQKMISRIKPEETELIKGTVELTTTDLAEELPDIDKNPIVLHGNGEVDIEIMSSPEKAGEDYDGWLLEVAERFNADGVTIDGKRVSVSVRSISSGTAADYILSGKHVPAAYTPSNELWGEMLLSQGVELEMVEEKLVGNVAGILLSDKTKKKIEEKYGKVSLQTVVQGTVDNEIAMGYTNPFSSSTGLNFLLETLYTYDKDDLLSTTAVEGFASFQKNVPFVAYTTMQMREAAASGSLDGMVMEYQTYINSSDLRDYVFIPFGVRHDSPMYALGGLSGTEKKVLEAFTEYCMDMDSQKKAKEYGFNENEDYNSSLELDGKTILEAQKLWKDNKDSGNSITAVFVADVSGSMSGAPINELKESLINAGQYINEDNRIGLVSFSDRVSINLPIAAFDLNQRAYFNGAVNNLVALGGTATYDGITVAVDMLVKAKADDPNTKLVLFLLSDGKMNTGYDLNSIKSILEAYEIPVYSIAYGDEADMEELKLVSSVNEATTISADSDDVVYQLKNLFNAQM
ncbi:MAG: VWA domain-containing protein [Lachnospiraceae bacterium]|nr:VWA domain-containing protein [Lachnospiraceae bacterium]